jgi:hypothetical protein
MITLERNDLVIRFPEVHADAGLRVSFQRTLRIPDDGRDYPLPPGFGGFPLHHVEDYAEKLSPAWRKRGGVFLPMYQSEALWLSFDSLTDYPVALQIGAGKINAVSGEPWNEEMQFDPQGYVVAPYQPWLDGFCVEKGRIRQFVAAPLGRGFTVEEQLTGEAEFGGIQLKAWPLKASVYEQMKRDQPMFDRVEMDCEMTVACASPEMGLGMGGSMKQEIYDDAFEAGDWDTRFSSRCFVSLLNSMAYANVTGHLPPHRPYEAADYAAAGLPWFDYYSDREALQGSGRFEGLKTWQDFAEDGPDGFTAEDIGNVVKLGPGAAHGRPVSEGEGL